jgi:hypothetical protein
MNSSPDSTGTTVSGSTSSEGDTPDTIAPAEDQPDESNVEETSDTVTE